MTIPTKPEVASESRGPKSIHILLPSLVKVHPSNLSSLNHQPCPPIFGALTYTILNRRSLVLIVIMQFHIGYQYVGRLL